MERLSNFSRTVANEAKCGAYYTDLSMVRAMRNFFEFSKEKEYLCADFSIGDAKALLTVTGKEKDDRKNLFGVEINSATCEELERLKDQGLLKSYLNGDFLHDVKISNRVFSFLFLNPPYGDERCSDGKLRRMEALHIEKAFNYIKAGGVLCLVVPETVLNLEGFQKTLIGRYKPYGVYRFPEHVYRQFHQCVVIATAKRTIGWKPSEIDEFNKWLADLKELPMDYDGQRIAVPESHISDLHLFTSLIFNPDACVGTVSKSSLRRVEREQYLVPTYRSGDLNPPIPLKIEHACMLATIGAGWGPVGDEQVGTLHLQRGIAERVEDTVETDTGELIVTERTVAHIVTVENDGEITVLS